MKRIKWSIYSVVISTILGLFISGCAITDKQNYSISNYKYHSLYHRYEKHISIGGYILIYGYNVVTFLPKNEQNIKKLKNILNVAYQKFTIEFKNSKTKMISPTSLSFRIKTTRNKNAINQVRYYLKADDTNVYLIENVGLIKGRRSIHKNYYIAHNMLIDICHENNIVPPSKNVKLERQSILKDYAKINM